MLQENGYLKVIDFGVAKMLEHGQTANTFTGTPHYLAPEMLAKTTDRSKAKEPYTNKVDWWYVGVMAYMMLVGRHPFIDNHKIN